MVRVRAAGVNPGESAIRAGLMGGPLSGHFPSGQGTEFAGLVVGVGPGVAGVGVGDAVIGFSDTRDAQADYVKVPAGNILPKPGDVAWDTAAAIPIAGATATSMIATVDPQPGETVVVAGGGGGVGFVATQLAVRAGARVIATAGLRDHDALRSIGARPVEYGTGVADRIRAAAPDGVDAFLDTNGHGNADLAVELGVPRSRIDTIIDFDAGQRLGIQTQGMYQLADIRGTLIAFADLVATSQVAIPIRATFPLERVQDAYRTLSSGLGVGKVVLLVSEG